MGSTSYQIDARITGREEALNYARQVLMPSTVIDHAYGRGDGRGASSGYGWGGVLYVLAERTDDTGATTVEAVVFLYGVNGSDGIREFCVKVVDESMGPNRIDCPKRFLGKLSPTTNTYALEWRAAVELFHQRRRDARRLIGQTITLPSPLHYGSPIGEVAEVRVESLNVWRIAAHPGYRLRPPAHWWMINYSPAT